MQMLLEIITVHVKKMPLTLINILYLTEVDHDQGGLAPPSVPDIKQPSPPSSDKPPTSARSGKGSVSDTRRMSASKRSGKSPLYHVVTQWDFLLSRWVVVFTIWGKVYLWKPLNNVV